MRVAPKLPGDRKIIRWHARDHARIAVRLEGEKVLVGPDIARVVRDEDGDVTDDANIFTVGAGFDGVPLRKKQPLHEGVQLAFNLEFPAGFGERGGIAAYQIGGPERPLLAFVGSFAGHEQRVILEPGGV